MRLQDEDTICAQATACGMGGIAVLRVSGRESLKIVRQICPFIPKNPKSHHVYFGSLCYQDQIIDEVLIIYFDQGRSFTSEQVVEICCHGSPVVSSEILHILQELGCRLADRGEFTYRAFLAGRIDLVQAENVLQLIEARSQGARRQALRQLQGEFSKILIHLQKDIQYMLAHIEAEIDFSEENLSVLTQEKHFGKIQKIRDQLKEMIQGYKQGQRVREGLKVGIFGPPNSGKSTLFNSLLKEDKAIVSSYAGTTRDQVEGEKFVQGQRICLIDTAGLRETTDVVEKRGLEKTFQTFTEADICLYVLDALFPSYTFLKFSEQNLKDHRLIFIVNKTDLKSKEDFLSQLKEEQQEVYEQLKHKQTFYISAQTGENVQDIENFFHEQLKNGETAVYLPRHYRHLLKALYHIERTQKLMNSSHEHLDLISFELKEVLKHIQNILGENVNVDVIDEIFQQFCIGK